MVEVSAVQLMARITFGDGVVAMVQMEPDMLNDSVDPAERHEAAVALERQAAALIAELEEQGTDGIHEQAVNEAAGRRDRHRQDADEADARMKAGLRRRRPPFQRQAGE